MVHVRYPEGVKVSGLYDPVWVEGVLAAADAARGDDADVGHTGRNAFQKTEVRSVHGSVPGYTGDQDPAHPGHRGQASSIPADIAPMAVKGSCFCGTVRLRVP